VNQKSLAELNFTDDLESDLKSVDCVLLLVEHDHPDTDIVKNYTEKMLWSP
jgi:UDP-N-acetyl-D-mannosaminuronate dehydrogenase